MLAYILVTTAFGIAGGLIYFYFQKKGQFDDTEEPKYQMLREKDSKIIHLSFGDEPIKEKESHAEVPQFTE